MPRAHRSFSLGAALVLLLLGNSAIFAGTNIVFDGNFESVTGTTPGTKTIINTPTHLDTKWFVSQGVVGGDNADQYVFEDRKSVV